MAVFQGVYWRLRRAMPGETGRSAKVAEEQPAKGKKAGKDAQRAQRKLEDKEAEKKRKRNQLKEASNTSFDLLLKDLWQEEVCIAQLSSLHVLCDRLCLWWTPCFS